MAIAAITLTACNSSTNKSTENKSSGTDTTQAKSQTENVTATTPSVADTKATVSIKEIVTAYLQLKNAFTKDNTTDAATAGTSLETAFKNFDKTALSADQKKAFEDIEDDAREHAEHIGKNGGNIAHQREHFVMLSKDMADLIKTFGNGGQTLYKDFCPMANDGKGAIWISEVKEIKNPYLGSKMPTCGTMKEEMK
jgi:hypothetical protein